MTIIDCEKQMDKIPEKTAHLCKKKKVLEAINVLKELNKKFLEDEAKKQPLLDETTDCPVFLQVTMKKIPYKKMSKRIKVLLPHSMVTDTTEVCLFTGDLDKRNKKAEIDPDVLHYKELLKKQGITKVTEVIPLRQLRTEYKVYEARRQLMAAYDVFLSDKKIAQCLPKLLGKAFIKKRKFPIQISMNTSNLKSQIEKALSETVFSVSCRGNSCASEVARLGMDDNEILENVLASVKILADKLPGEQDNIFGIYIKTAKSQAIPIFISFGNPNEVKLRKPRNHEKVELEELSTLPNAEVKVFRDGRIFVKKTLADSGPEVVNEIKLRHGKRKRTDAKAADEEVNEGNLEVKSESESVVEDAEEDISPSKTKLKKKRKTSVKKESQEDEESEESEVSSEATEMHLKDESEVEDIEEDTSANKTKLRNKRGKRKRMDAEAVDEDINEGNLEVKSESESVVEDAEEDISPSKTKLKKKRKTSVKKESQEDEESEESEVSSEATEMHLKDESEVEDIEEDTSANKTKLRNKRGKRKRMDAEAADEDINEGNLEVKSESESVVEDAEEDISPSKTKLKKKHKTSVKKESQGDEESEESEVSSEATEMHLKDESEVEDIEEDTRAYKTKLRNKHGKASVKKKVQDETENTRKRKSVNAVEDEDVNKSTAQLKLRKKKTADIKIEESVRVLRKAQPKVRNNRIGCGDKKNLRQRS